MYCCTYVWSFKLRFSTWQALLCLSHNKYFDPFVDHTTALLPFLLLEYMQAAKNNLPHNFIVKSRHSVRTSTFRSYSVSYSLYPQEEKLQEIMKYEEWGQGETPAFLFQWPAPYYYRLPVQSPLKLSIDGFKGQITQSWSYSQINKSSQYIITFTHWQNS